MITTALPEHAFLPRDALNPEELARFQERRDKLLALTSAASQECIRALAKSHGSHRVRLLPDSNLFGRSFTKGFYHRMLPFMNPKPNLLERGLAKVHVAVGELDNWRGRRAYGGLLGRLRAMIARGEADVAMGVIHFFRALPLEVGYDSQRALDDALDDMAVACCTSPLVPAARRVDAAVRCMQSSVEPDGVPGTGSSSILRERLWPLLLELANDDMPAATRLIDQHWQGGRSDILMTLCLHDTPELAYRLAIKVKTHRPAFAAAMLCESIYVNKFKLDKLDAPSAAALQEIMDAACRLLAEWTLDEAGADPVGKLKSMESLLQFGNPADAYWRSLPAKILPMVQALDAAQQDQQLRIIAQTAFYAPQDSAIAADARALFAVLAARRLGHPSSWTFAFEQGLRDACVALCVLEDKVLSLRNRRIDALPEHPLLSILDAHLEVCLDSLRASEPESALQHRVSMIHEHALESSIRHLHQLFRTEFAGLARTNPADAGRALKSVIQYCGYSQLQDQMYKKTLCQESFDQLLPALKAISPADAAVARAGVGWSPRPDWL